MEKSKALQACKSSKNLAPKASLTTNTKGTLHTQKTQEKEKAYKNKPKAIKKMSIGKYI